MSGLSPDFEYTAGKHYRTRAIGQLVVGPMAAVGYNNKVIKLTREDIDFKSEEEALGFLDYHKRKYAPVEKLKVARSLKMVSRNDD